MNFHLVYSGNLPSAGNKSKPAAVRDIRDKLHPQLCTLWQTHGSLKRLRWTSWVPAADDNDGRIMTADSPFIDFDDDPKPGDIPDNFVNLCEPIIKGKKSYVPLVRKSLDLTCSLNIMFLRQEEPGNLVSQGGDLDGRLKTLFDALRAPDADVEINYPQAQDQTYCLLEEDTLISGFEVTTGRLLFPSSDHRHEVHIVIEVQIRVLRMGYWNMALM